MSDRSWKDIIPHEQVRAELDFIADSIRNREMLKAEGLSIKRGLLLSGPPGDGKSTAIECFVNGIAGEASIIIVEAVDHIRAVYHLAQTLAPAVVILEDLDLMTRSRQNPYAYAGKDDVTGELLQVLSGGSAYADIVTIATTNHPEAIDEALAKRAGRFDAHIRMGYPSDADKQRILDLYLDRFGVSDDFTRRRLQQTLNRDLGRLHLVPAHIEEFVKAGIKRARLAHRAPEYLDFEPGIEATKSIAVAKPPARAGRKRLAAGQGLGSSLAFASSHSASISASVASCGAFPRAASACSIAAKAALEFLVGLPQQRFRIGAQMPRQIDGGKEKVADFGRGCSARSPSSASSISSASSRILRSTARGSFQSKPTWLALACSFSARVRAGSADRHAGQRALLAANGRAPPFPAP